VQVLNNAKVETKKQNQLLREGQFIKEINEMSSMKSQLYRIDCST
jgi:hypothetical protein